MGLLIKLSLLVCVSLVESRGLLAPAQQKKDAAPVKAAPAKVSDDDSDSEMMPPMEAFESVDSDVDQDADKKELEAEDEARRTNHHSSFGVHKEGEKDTPQQHQRVDPMDALHKHRLGDLGEAPKQPKAAPVSAKKTQPAPAQPSHLSSLKNVVGADEETPKPVEKKQEVAKVENKTEVPVSAETIAKVEKMKAQREAEKAAAKAPKIVTQPPKAEPKKAHNLGKDLESISKGDMAPLDDKVVAKLKAAMPAPKKAPVQRPAVHEHAHGDVLGRLHAHAQEAKATTETHTTTTIAAPRPRKATPQQLAAAKRASSLTDALRGVNASDVKLNLDISDSAARHIEAIDDKTKREADQVEKALTPPNKPVDHMEELRETAEKELAKKVHHMEVKKEQKSAAKQEKSLSKLAEALGMDQDSAPTTTTTVAPAKKSSGGDAINALHVRLHHDDPKKVEKPKAVAKPVQQKKNEDPEEEKAGVISGFHHNKARDNLPPVLR